VGFRSAVRVPVWKMLHTRQHTNAWADRIRRVERTRPVLSRLTQQRRASAVCARPSALRPCAPRIPWCAPRVWPPRAGWTMSAFWRSCAPDATALRWRRRIVPRARACGVLRAIVSSRPRSDDGPRGSRRRRFAWSPLTCLPAEAAASRLHGAPSRGRSQSPASPSAPRACPRGRGESPRARILRPASRATCPPACLPSRASTCLCPASGASCAIGATVVPRGVPAQLLHATSASGSPAPRGRGAQLAPAGASEHVGHTRGYR
jgi:hypothetical protein